MRFLTVRVKNALRPALWLDDAWLLDLTEGFASARRQGLVPAGQSAPETLIDVIAGGNPVRKLCSVLEAAAKRGELRSSRLNTEDCTVVAPIPRPLKNVFCVGKNYAEHVSEGARALKIDVNIPEYPVYFSKPPTAVVGPFAQKIVQPSPCRDVVRVCYFEEVPDSFPGRPGCRQHRP